MRQDSQFNPPNCAEFWGVYTLKWAILNLKAAKAHKLGYLFRVDNIVTITNQIFNSQLCCKFYVLI